MKNYGDLGGCYPPRPTASTDNTLLDLHNSSYDTQPHSFTVNYSCTNHRCCKTYSTINKPINMISMKCKYFYKAINGRDVLTFASLSLKPWCTSAFITYSMFLTRASIFTRIIVAK